MKITLIIPVFNEEKTIKDILKRVSGLDIFDWKKEIIVVDDGSTDKTKKALQEFSVGKEIKTLFLAKNFGKGMAIREGLQIASGDYVCIQDADKEYYPEDLRAMILVARYNPGMAIFGSRFRGKHEDVVFGHKMANVFLTNLTNFLYGSELSDMETCYKLIPRKALSKFVLECRGFEFEPEITAKLLLAGFKILEVPIRYFKRGYSEGKKIRFYDGLMAIWTLFKYRFIR